MRDLRLNACIIFVCALLISLNATIAAQRRAASRPAQQERLKTPSNDNWFVVTSPDGDFTATFPVKPYFKVEDHQGTRAYKFIASHNDYTLMVEHYDINLEPHEIQSFDESKLREYQEARMMQELRDDGWKILSSRDLAGNGYQQVSFVPPKKPGGPGHYFRAINFFHRLRTNLVRVYLITFKAPTRLELFGPEAKRFFDYFKFTSRE